MFLNNEDFSWTKQLIDSWEAIRKEYDTVANAVIEWPEAIHNGLWSVYGILHQGRDLGVKHITPITAQICDDIPNIHTYGFSILKPGCEIHKHVGYNNKVLRCHLGLYTNEYSSIEVDGEKYTWQDGKVTIFDDTKLHCAWNRGSSNRVILLLDFKR